MLNETQRRLLADVYAYANGSDIAEDLVDLFEGWYTNNENSSAPPVEKAGKFFIVRRLAAFFREADKQPAPRKFRKKVKRDFRHPQNQS